MAKPPIIEAMNTVFPLHQELGSRLAGLIRAGTFPAGSRFPSIRHTSREHRVSISTVMEAYCHLEDAGLIEARPRSGYFVAPDDIVTTQGATEGLLLALRATAKAGAPWKRFPPSANSRRIS